MFQIREALDCGEEFTAQCSPHSYADVLQALIAGFPTPLLPYDLYPTSEVDNQQMRMWARKFLDALLPLNYNVFVYLMSFFREVLQQREYNRYVAPVWGRERWSFMIDRCVGRAWSDWWRCVSRS